MNISNWGGFICLWFSMTTVFVTGLGVTWKFWQTPALAREIKSQLTMLILCYASGVGWGYCAIFINQLEKESRTFDEIMLCVSFGQYASMGVYFYRVWLFYWKCKLQDEFEKVLTSSSIKLENLNENELNENLLKCSTPESVRTSFFVRNKLILSRNIMSRTFWLFPWICQCIAVFSTYQRRDKNKPILQWSMNALANAICGIFPRILCFVVLFLFPNDDIFRIKIELRLIFFISIVQMVLFYILLDQIGKFAAFFDLSMAAFAIMVTIISSNGRAVQIPCCCISGNIFRQQRTFQLVDSIPESEIKIMDILEREDMFQAFQRHLKREFSIENLNFIVNVVYYRQFCAQYININDNKTDLCIRGKETAHKLQEISLQPITVSSNPILKTISSTSASQCGGEISVGAYSEMGNFSPNRIFLDNKAGLGMKNTRQITWLKSEIELYTDKWEAALFIFKEYCAWGAPQEINISRNDRNELIEFFSESLTEPEKLNTIFDRTFNSVVDLLQNDSLRRFKRHPSFTKISKL